MVRVPTAPNDGLPPGNGLKEPQINSPTSPEGTENNDADNMQDSYDWPMDLDGGDDGGFSGVEPTQNPPDVVGEGMECRGSGKRAFLAGQIA